MPMRGFSTVRRGSKVSKRWRCFEKFVSHLQCLAHTWTYRDACPCTNDSSQELTTPNVDVLWTKGDKVVGGTDGVCRDVNTERDDEQANGAKGRCSAATMRARSSPIIYDFNRIPDDPAIGCLSRCSGEDAEKTDDGKDEGNDEGLHILGAGSICIS